MGGWRETPNIANDLRKTETGSVCASSGMLRSEKSEGTTAEPAIYAKVPRCGAFVPDYVGVTISGARTNH